MPPPSFPGGDLHGGQYVGSRPQEAAWTIVLPEKAPNSDSGSEKPQGILNTHILKQLHHGQHAVCSARLPYEGWFESQRVLQSSSMLVLLRKHWKTAQVVGHLVTLVGDPGGIPGSWLQRGQAH